jgi:uncharacterized membrane protein YcaP (DUF421 family)
VKDSIEIIVRTLIAYTWLWGYTQLIGRRLIAQSTSNLFVLSIIIGTIGGNMAFNIKISLMHFLLSLFVISAVGYILLKLSLQSEKASTIISGEPIVIINNGVLLVNEMKRCKYSLEALKQGMRGKEIFDLKQVEYAVLEINGTLSVLKKREYRNVTWQDLDTLKK